MYTNQFRAGSVEQNPRFREATLSQLSTLPGHLIRRLNQISNRVFAEHMEAAGFDMTSVQFAALDAIAHMPGIDQAGVALEIDYDRATIGGVIDRLERKGLIARKVKETDKRARELTLTEAGQAAYRAAKPHVSSLQDDILASLTPAERAALLNLLQKAVHGSPATPQS